jgi:hypothetical protein
MSTGHANLVFKKAVGMTIFDYLTACRKGASGAAGLPHLHRGRAGRVPKHRPLQVHVQEARWRHSKGIQEKAFLRADGHGKMDRKDDMQAKAWLSPCLRYCLSP